MSDENPAGGLPDDRYARLQRAVSAFNKARKWKKFHAPKNLAMALAIEAAELMEPLRWSTPADSWKLAKHPATREEITREMADVLLVLTSLADYLQIDLLAAAQEKLALNEQRYPAAQAKGRSDKYTAYEGSRAATKKPVAQPEKVSRGARRGAAARAPRTRP